MVLFGGLHLLAVLVLALIDLRTIRMVDDAAAAAIRPRGNRSRAAASGANAVRATGVAHRPNHTAISAIAASITRLSSTASASAAASFGAQKLAQA